VLQKGVMRTFSKEFKEEAVRLVLDQGVTLSQASRDLGINISSLRNWLSKHREKQGVTSTSTESEAEELRRLRKENAVLKMERDILKKATAYFSRTSLPDAGGL
jgi:transposase